MSAATVLADAVAAALTAAFPSGPAVARRWRVDLEAEDVPEAGLIYVTLGEASRDRISRRTWRKRIQVNVVSVQPITMDSKDGPANGDTFADRHDAIGAALEAMPEGTVNISEITESLPMQGETHDGEPILLSTFTLSFQ